MHLQASQTHSRAAVGREEERKAARVFRSIGSILAGPVNVINGRHLEPQHFISDGWSITFNVGIDPERGVKPSIFCSDVEECKRSLKI